MIVWKIIKIFYNNSVCKLHIVSDQNARQIQLSVKILNTYDIF